MTRLFVTTAMVISWSAFFAAGCFRNIEPARESDPICGTGYALKLMYQEDPSGKGNARYDEAYSTFERAGDLLESMEPEAAGELFLEAARLFDPVPGMSACNREVVTYNREYSYRSARVCYVCVGDDEAVARVDEILGPE